MRLAQPGHWGYSLGHYTSKSIPGSKIYAAWDALPTEQVRLRVRCCLEHILVQNFLAEHVGLLDPFVKTNLPCPNGLEIVVHRINELGGTSIGRTIPRGRSIGEGLRNNLVDRANFGQPVTLPTIGTATRAT